jgi:hypothetical protein
LLYVYIFLNSCPVFLGTCINIFIGLFWCA